MIHPHDTPNAGHREELSRLMGAKAQALFASGQMLCAPAVLEVLNRALGGGLDSGLLLRLTGGLIQGMGGAGCVCGALSGGNLALGLFLGTGKKRGRGARRLSRAAKQLHNQFKDDHGATCCRALTRKVKHDKKLHTQQCSGLTGRAAEIAACLILEQRPELGAHADLDYLTRLEPKSSRLKRALTALSALGA